MPCDNERKKKKRQKRHLDKDRREAMEKAPGGEDDLGVFRPFGLGSVTCPCTAWSLVGVCPGSTERLVDAEIFSGRREGIRCGFGFAFSAIFRVGVSRSEGRVTGREGGTGRLDS